MNYATAVVLGCVYCVGPASRPVRRIDLRKLGSSLYAHGHSLPLATGAGPALNPVTMFASMFCSTELPIEILEQILLHLPGQDIIRMEVVWCTVIISRDPVLTFSPWSRLADSSGTSLVIRQRFSTNATSSPLV